MVFASGYIKRVDDIFLTLEYTNEGSALMKKQKPNDNWEIKDYKLYGEYGLFKNLTIGGFVKKYSFLHKLYFARSEIQDDFYGNIFFASNLFEMKEVFFYYKSGYYFPIEYDDFWSKILNNIETKKSFDTTISMFKEGKVENYNWYIDGGLAYKFIQNGYRDEFKKHITIAIGERENENFGVSYEEKKYIGGDNVYCSPDGQKICYHYDNSTMYKFFANVKFDDKVGCGFSIYKKYSLSNSTGISFNVFFN
ncbi:MAG: hypothetical protein LBT02_01835 [Rickettsiales bacterium]|jgi:hypothetical protein|nr:hypothetical protein [Rickettsiales bacterium]